MIQCRLINNSTHDLKEREAQFKDFGTSREEPHILLSTCNRIEEYWGDGDVPEELLNHLYRVASGLESSLLGERAIQGQLKQAYFDACAKYHLSPSLNRLFQSAIYTGRRVRNETKISEGAVSHSHATVEIIKHENVDLKNKIISIIGVNKLTEDILKYLASRGATNIFLSNRNHAKAEELAAKYDGTAMLLNKKRRLLEFTDVLISATSAPHLIVHAEDVPKDKEMLIFDLAFPRDVSEEIASFPKIKLYNLEDIELFAKKNVSLRRNEIGEAERIIEEEIAKFRLWQSYSEKAICL